MVENAAAHFQARVSVLHLMQNSFKKLLDDSIIYAKEADELYQNIDSFLTACAEHNLKLSAKKGKFFQTKVKWCGQNIDTNGTGIS